MKKIRFSINVIVLGGFLEYVLGSVIDPKGSLGTFQSFILAMTISVLVGLLIEVTLSYIQAVSEFNQLVGTLNKIRQTWHYNELLLNALNSTKNERHQPFVKTLLDKSVGDNIWQIHKQSAIDFYHILIDGFNFCKRWEGVHDGSITQLVEDQPQNNSDDNRLVFARKRYLESLRDYSSKRKSKDFIARRIIILDRKNREELKNLDLMKKFWESTGKQVKSYWIEKESIERELQDQNLDDAALLDSQIFLQYDRKEKIVRFNSDEHSDEKLKIIKKLFVLLDTPSTIYQFHPITKEMCIPSGASIKSQNAKVKRL